MKDTFIRRVIKKIALGCFGLDLKVTRSIKKLGSDKPFHLAGTCNQCGSCCEEPTIGAGGLVWYVPLIRKLFLIWQHRVNGFEFLERDISQRSFVFKCTHLDKSTGLCDSYESRPGMCRDYPRIHLYSADPDFFQDCGYRPLDPQASQIIKNLEEHGVPGEQVEEMKKDFFLE